MTKVVIDYNLPNYRGNIHIEAESQWEASNTLEEILKKDAFAFMREKADEATANAIPVAPPAYKWDPAPEAEKIRLDDEDIPY